MNINVKLDKDAYMPEKAYKSDAGFDIKTPRESWVLSKKSAVVDTGVHVEIPEGYVGFLKSKSGLNVQKSITSEGVIDSGYTGAIVVKLYNNSKSDYKFNAGDKITQLVILPIPEIELTLVDEFKTTERGNNGFGSTGK